MNENYAKYLLEKTQQDYNLIAENFSNTRSFLPRDIESLENHIKDSDKILDLGCGNGRFVELIKNRNVDYTGIDNSEKLIAIAKDKYPQINFIVASVFNLPFPDNYFDKVFMLAVLHHIPSNKFRLKVLREVKRVLKPEGILILTVWNLWQVKTAWSLLIKNTLAIILRRSKLDFKDIFYPWKDSKKKILIQRYFHLFTKRELKGLVKKAAFKIKESGTIKRGRKYSNIYLLAEK